MVPSWERELSEIGTLRGTQVHVDLVYVARFGD